MVLNKKIVKKIGNLVNSGYSDAWIQSAAWLMRDANTSMENIKLIIKIFRLYFSEDKNEE